MGIIAGAPSSMTCPECGGYDFRVVDSRPIDEENAIRRRRKCGNCGRRRTTIERIDERDVTPDANHNTRRNGREVVEAYERLNQFDRRTILRLMGALENTALEAVVEGDR